MCVPCVFGRIRVRFTRLVLGDSVNVRDTVDGPKASHILAWGNAPGIKTKTQRANGPAHDAAGLQPLWIGGYPFPGRWRGCLMGFVCVRCARVVYGVRRATSYI